MKHRLDIYDEKMNLAHTLFISDEKLYKVIEEWQYKGYTVQLDEKELFLGK